MADDLGNRYFREIQRAWAPFERDFRIIPFCTAVFKNPSVLVIGINHSDFDPRNAHLSATIADQFAARVPKVSTFLVHNHTFAVGLREVCRLARITIDEAWIGTNRCAVQTGSGGTAILKNSKQFDKCQKTMDTILREFVAEIVPRNVILTGKEAAGVYYPNAEKSTFSALQPRDELLSKSRSTRLIPIEHPSRIHLIKDKASRRLADFFVR